MGWSGRPFFKAFSSCHTVSAHSSITSVYYPAPGFSPFTIFLKTFHLCQNGFKLVVSISVSVLASLLQPWLPYQVHRSLYFVCQSAIIRQRKSEQAGEQLDLQLQGLTSEGISEWVRPLAFQQNLLIWTIQTLSWVSWSGLHRHRWRQRWQKGQSRAAFGRQGTLRRHSGRAEPTLEWHFGWPRGRISRFELGLVHLTITEAQWASKLLQK